MQIATIGVDLAKHVFHGSIRSLGPKPVHAACQRSVVDGALRCPRHLATRIYVAMRHITQSRCLEAQTMQAPACKMLDPNRRRRGRCA